MTNDQMESTTKPALMSSAAATLLERVVVGGDLSKLTATERMS